MKLIFAICVIIILGGCSATQKANKHLRKAKKHILKAESFGAKWQVDTIYKKVAVLVPSVKRDTVFKSEVGDTVVITKDRLQVKYVRLAGDSVFIKGECKADTIYKEVPITITRQIHTPDKWRSPAIGMAVIILLIFLGGLGYLYLKK